MESHCLFRVGFSSLIKSISKIRQSSLFWHFLNILKFRAKSFGDILCWSSVHRADSCIDLPTEDCKLSAYCICRFLVEIKVREDKPPIVNQQCVVYHFQCNLCDAGYVGYTCRHNHQRIEEHKGTAVGNHLKDQHSMSPNDLREILKFSGSARTNLIALLLKCFLLKNWNQI